MVLDIVINVNEKVNKYAGIKIDRESVELLIKCINDFVQGYSDVIEYSTYENDFSIRILPNKTTKTSIINQLRKSNYGEEIEGDLKEVPEQYSLLFVLDNCKYYNKISTGTGIAYLILVTKEHLSEFAVQLEMQYMEYFKSKIKFL